MKNVQRTVTRTIKNNFMDGAKQVGQKGVKFGPEMKYYDPFQEAIDILLGNNVERLWMAPT